MYTYFVKFSSVFELISSYEHFQPKPYNYVDTGRLSGTCGRGLSSIRALLLTWRALKVFFPLGVDKTISRVSLYEAYFVRTYR